MFDGQLDCVPENPNKLFEPKQVKMTMSWFLDTFIIDFHLFWLNLFWVVF